MRTFSFVASLAVLAVTGGHACAAPITYQILSFHGAGSATGFGSNGFAPYNIPLQGVVAGTITTDGALGDITSSDVIAWNWNAAGLGGSPAQYATSSVTASGLYATNDALSLLPTASNGGNGDIIFDAETTSSVYVLGGSELFFEAVNGGITWEGSNSSVTGGHYGADIGGTYTYPSLVFATVEGGIPPGIPEPSTFILAAIGAGALIVRRLRR